MTITLDNLKNDSVSCILMIVLFSAFGFYIGAIVTKLFTATVDRFYPKPAIDSTDPNAQLIQAVIGTVIAAIFLFISIPIARRATRNC